MRCPKCHYLSFEPEPRCRNCGYDLSFDPGDPIAKPVAAVEEVLPDLELRIHELDAEIAPAPPVTTSVRPALSTPAPVPTTELPLFVQGLPEAITQSPPWKAGEPFDVEIRSGKSDDFESLIDFDAPPAERGADEPADVPDEPLVRVPAAPRPPLAVRRPTPAPGRVREKYQAQRPEAGTQIGLLERGVMREEGPNETPWPLIGPDPAPEAPDAHAPLSAYEGLHEPAGAGRRLEAALVDVLFIGSINAAIVWLTLQRLELSISQIGALPIPPVAALLFMLDTLYLLMFTATNGQTVGKMAAGIRVVGESSHAFDRVTLKQATLRAVLTFPSVLVLGVGFIPALVGKGVALHDRFTHTRVVRA